MNFRSSICTLVIVMVAIVSVAHGKALLEKSKESKNHHKIILVDDIHDFIREHPGLQLQQLTKQPGLARSNTARYTLGNRITGDRLVAQSGDSYAYPAKKDVTIQLTYPEEGTGSIVNYVEIACVQDNKDGNAYIVAGGIGQRFISVVVEADQTETFSYTAQFFGTN